MLGKTHSNNPLLIHTHRPMRFRPGAGDDNNQSRHWSRCRWAVFAARTNFETRLKDRELQVQVPIERWIDEPKQKKHRIFPPHRELLRLSTHYSRPVTEAPPKVIPVVESRPAAVGGHASALAE